MKQNRKNKKLLFIRKKNNLRLGKESFIYVETFSESYFDELSNEDIKQELTNEAKKILYKKYKLKLNKVDFLISYYNDDFITNSISIKLKLSLK